MVVVVVDRLRDKYLAQVMEVYVAVIGCIFITTIGNAEISQCDLFVPVPLSHIFTNESDFV